MAELQEFIKYYSPEDYLFGEVNRNFQERGYLTPEEFFAIVIWKSNRAKTKVKRGIQESGKTIEAITSAIAKAKTQDEKLAVLLGPPRIRGIRIPIASAILSVCYPSEFTIADYRVRASLEQLGAKMDGDPTSSVKAYREYLKHCQQLSPKFGLSLRDFDRALWGKDFYEGRNGLKSLALSDSTNPTQTN